MRGEQSSSREHAGFNITKALSACFFRNSGQKLTKGLIFHNITKAPSVFPGTQDRNLQILHIFLPK
jgi:hypothetical protein